LQLIFADGALGSHETEAPTRKGGRRDDKMKLGQLMCLASLNLVAIARPRLRDLFEDISFRSPGFESELELELELGARYRQMIVVRFNLTTVDDAAAIEKAIERFSKDVWAYGRDFVDIGMNGKDLPSFLSVLPPTLGSAYTTLIHDVASLVHNTYPATYRNGNTSPTFLEVLQKVLDEESGRTRVLLSEDDSIFFSDYQPLSVRLPFPGAGDGASYLRLQTKESRPSLTCDME
jgi:hypothetical protein